jgi:hypothetical protein
LLIEMSGKEVDVVVIDDEQRDVLTLNISQADRDLLLEAKESDSSDSSSSSTECSIVQKFENDSEHLSDKLKSEGDQPMGKTEEKLLHVIMSLEKDLGDTVIPDLKFVKEVVEGISIKWENSSYPESAEEGWKKFHEGRHFLLQLKTLKNVIHSKIIPLLKHFELQITKLNHNNCQHIIKLLDPVGLTCKNARLEAQNVVKLILRSMLNIRSANLRWQKAH